MSLAERRWLRLFTLSALFFAQGIPWGFFAIGLPAYLAQQKLDDATIAVVFTASYWPFVFKWVWGPAIDAFTIPRFGRRRPWIVFAQAMMAVTAAGMIFVRDIAGSVDLLIVLILLHTICNAMQNVATDALAIDLLDPSERGRANGFMYGFKWAGGIVGGFAMPLAIEHLGFEVAILLEVALLSVILLLPLLVTERGGPPPARPRAAEIVGSLARIYRLRSPWLALAMMLLASSANGLLDVAAPKLLVGQLQWDVGDYSFLVGFLGMVCGFAGSMLAGLVADKIGHRRLAAIASLVLAAAWVTFAFGQAWWHSPAFIYTLALVSPVTQSIMIVSLWSVCMSVSIKRTAATQFAAYTSLTSLSIIIGAHIEPHARQWWDFPTIYIACAIFQAALVVILPFIDPKQVSRELGAE